MQEKLDWDTLRKLFQLEEENCRPSISASMAMAASTSANCHFCGLPGHLQKKPITRFAAYEELFSIQKQENDTLPSLCTRVEEAMFRIKNLRDKEFTLADLDRDLQCMALIRALPWSTSKHSGLLSSCRRS